MIIKFYKKYNKKELQTCTDTKALTWRIINNHKVLLFVYQMTKQLKYKHVISNT